MTLDEVWAVLVVFVSLLWTAAVRRFVYRGAKPGGDWNHDSYY